MPAKINDVRAFDAKFNEGVESLGKSEKITKDVLKYLANMAIDATHQFQVPHYMNNLRAVLSPVNKRAFTMFCQRFGGFHFDEGAQLFDKKSGKKWEPSVKNWAAKRENPHFNIWTWQEIDLGMEDKAAPYTIEDFKASATKSWKKAHKANLSNVEILKAILSVSDKADHCVFSIQDVSEALMSMGIEGNLSVEEDSILAPKNDNVGNVAKAEPAPF